MRAILVADQNEAYSLVYALESGLPGAESTIVRAGHGPHEERPEYLLVWRYSSLHIHPRTGQMAVTLSGPLEDAKGAVELDASWFEVLARPF